MSEVNLNFVLCPAVVDPFRGPYYRTFAVFHQAFCLLTLGKIYTLVINLFLKVVCTIRKENDGQKDK